ncbi:NAD-binding protein [Agaribacter marinus]|uniref:NAD(P)-dependent oxidoreductase n=2 Tax=Virgibacillus salarius TaxID=447199 RepID=A0A941DY52_9BACI|nr:NAD(P)-dependent oxidoreductase [Virgibacillus salarius]MBR7797249.1 NAD(P)-dependent oxidoreductase [Virgibacillus salarius]NAZ09959.1 NAD-binding protein [Agaribacter marinus]
MKGEVNLNTKDMNIGFIGIGVMGKSMALNLIQAGYNLSIYTRTKLKAEQLLKAGATWQDSPALLAQSSDIIITMVGYPKDVEAIYFGKEGILNYISKGTYLIDMTTSKPSLAVKIAEEAREKDCHALDAPVSGGDIGAKNGKLAIMIGGETEAFDKVFELFQVMGENIVLQGKAGAGQHTKLANQITIASNMIGVCEAVAYTKKAGLDPMRVLTSITTGAAGSWSLSNLAPRMIKEDYSPGFFVKHFIKDMKIALETAEEIGLKTHGLKLSLQLYEEIEEKGEADSGTQALIKLFE